MPIEAQRWVELLLCSCLTSALDGGEWSTPRPAALPRERTPVSLVEEARWALGPVWTREKNTKYLAPTEARIPKPVTYPLQKMDH
jgi:hypothetical protein